MQGISEPRLTEENSEAKGDEGICPMFHRQTLSGPGFQSTFFYSKTHALSALNELPPFFCPAGSAITYSTGLLLENPYFLQRSSLGKMAYTRQVTLCPTYDLLVA